MRVEFNLIEPLSKLESSKRRRYTYSEIADLAELSRQTVRNVMNEPPTQVNVQTIGGLLKFFEREGMPITVSQLFDVQQDPLPAR